LKAAVATGEIKTLSAHHDLCQILSQSAEQGISDQVAAAMVLYLMDNPDLTTLLINISSRDPALGSDVLSQVLAKAQDLETKSLSNVKDYLVQMAERCEAQATCRSALCAQPNPWGQFHDWQHLLTAGAG
jgi:hypothetical protein